MTRQTRKASDATFRTAKPREKPYKLFDGGGLYLPLVTPEGGRYWRLKYRFGGHERGLGLGVHIDAATGELRAAEWSEIDLESWERCRTSADVSLLCFDEAGTDVCRRHGRIVRLAPTCWFLPLSIAI